MFKHILVPVDGSKTASLAVEKAREAARVFGSRVTVVYVLDPYPFASAGPDFAFGQAQYMDVIRKEAEQSLQAAQQAFEQDGLPVQTMTVNSYAAWKGIIDAADQVQADVIMMGSHGRRGVEKMVLGSVAQRVVSHAHTSVLVVRHDKPKAQD